MSRQLRLGVQIVASLTIVAATFAPWATSGERTLDAYDTATIADRLELTSLPWLRPIAVIPFVLALALLLRWSERPVLAATMGAGAAAYTLAAAIGTWLTLAPPHRAGGPILGAVAALALLAASLAEVGSSGGAGRLRGSTHRRR